MPDTLTDTGTRIRELAKKIPLDKLIDALCAASCAAGIVGAVGKVKGVAGALGTRGALRVLGGSLGAVGGALSIAGIALSTFIATDELMVELATNVLDSFLAQGASEEETLKVIRKLPVSDPLTQKLEKHVEEHFHGVNISCTCTDVSE